MKDKIILKSIMKTFSGVFNRASFRKHEDSTGSTTESINEIFFEYTNQVY